MSEKCRHTPCPKGYVDFCDWADKMSKTHDQIKCEVCGLYAVWAERSDATDPGNVSQKEEKCDVESIAMKHQQEMPRDDHGRFLPGTAMASFLAGSAWRLQWVLELLNSKEAHEFQRQHGSFMNVARWKCWLEDRANGVCK